HLLSHSSGLPAHRPYYEELYRSLPGDKKGKIKNWILSENLCFAPGTDTLYSDLGFILLGLLIEEKSGERLNLFWEKEIIAPLKLQKELFFPQKRDFHTGQCIFTEKCIWSGQMLCGEVHDDNCRAMGGVAGHAGLFGTAPAVLSLCEHLLEQFKGREEHPSYSSELLRLLLQRVDKKGWSCGFDTVTKGNSSSGKFFSEGSRGHLGFTGTSFWIDFEKEKAVVLLTNRVHMSGGQEGIQKLRPQIHNAIMK
ncbi:MAG: serine hydrolase, partial [Deltaproteobacteria bacterium]|nr:serine hydrolase [Deltaproteobacteria bacterium]